MEPLELEREDEWESCTQMRLGFTLLLLSLALQVTSLVIVCVTLRPTTLFF